MPKRTDIHKILIIGAGPIVIGQACEFDYSGTQACKALREEGFEVVLVNSNPATIMTDPEMADRTYIEPITPEVVEQILAVEKPDAVLPTLGGQTGLNVGLALYENGALDRHGCILIGASAEAIRKAEDRDLFKRCMEEIGLESAAASWRTASTRPGRSATWWGCLASCGPASRSAAPEAASPTTARSSTGWSPPRWSSARCTPSWSRRASSAGKNSRWRSCAMAPTTP